MPWASSASTWNTASVGRRFLMSYSRRSKGDRSSPAVQSMDSRSNSEGVWAAETSCPADRFPNRDSLLAWTALCYFQKGTTLLYAGQGNRLSRLGKRSAARRWSWFSRQLSLLYQVGKLSSWKFRAEKYRLRGRAPPVAPSYRGQIS